MSSDITNHLTSFIHKFYKAIVEKNEKILGELTSSELVYGHSNGKIEDKSSFINTIISGKSKFITISISHQHIILQGTLAKVKHKLKARTHDHGKELENIELIISLTLKQDDERWLLTERIATKNPAA